MGIDEAGAKAGCAVVNQEGELIVGRDEAFYFNTLDGRGPCFACEGTPAAAAVLLSLGAGLMCRNKDCEGTPAAAGCRSDTLEQVVLLV